MPIIVLLTSSPDLKFDFDSVLPSETKQAKKLPCICALASSSGPDRGPKAAQTVLFSPRTPRTEPQDINRAREPESTPAAIRRLRHALRRGPRPVPLIADDDEPPLPAAVSRAREEEEDNEPHSEPERHEPEQGTSTPRPLATRRVRFTPSTAGAPEEEASASEEEQPDSGFHSQESVSDNASPTLCPPVPARLASPYSTPEYTAPTRRPSRPTHQRIQSPKRHVRTRPPRRQTIPTKNALLDGMSPRTRFYAKKLAKRTVATNIKLRYGMEKEEGGSLRKRPRAREDEDREDGEPRTPPPKRRRIGPIESPASPTPAPAQSSSRKRARDDDDDDAPHTPPPKRARTLSTPLFTPASPSPRAAAMPRINPTRFARPGVVRAELGRDARRVQMSPTGVPEIQPPEYLDPEWRGERARLRRSARKA
ncbi:hypothetical protein HWV62_14164 [Athelia sp. TMB]|nr:hypothetical protein HWV62_14164 [Athelia sp. TMB]